MENLAFRCAFGVWPHCGILVLYWDLGLGTQGVGWRV